MESDKLNNGENPPASTSPVQENDEFSFTIRQNDAPDDTGIFHNDSSTRADLMSYPYMPYTVAPFSWKHMHGTYQPYTHSILETCDNFMVDLNQLHNLQYPLIDPSYTNTSSNIPSLYRQDVPFPERNVKGLSYARDKIGAADTVMNDSAHFNFQNTEINRNFMLIKGNAGGGYEMTRQGGEADSSNIYGPQIKSFVDLGGSKTMIYHPQNSEEINNIHNNHQVNATQFGSPKKIDGSFLSLGIGGKTDAISKSDPSSRVITGKLDGAVSPLLNTSHVQQATGRSLNPSHNLVGGFSRVQNNFGGFRSLGHNAGCWTSSNNNVGIMRGTNTGLNSSPFHTSQIPQADMQHGFPKSSNRNLGFVGNRDPRYPSLDPYKGFTGELATSSRPFSSSSAGLLDSGYTGASGLASESVKFTRNITRPTSDELQKLFMETVPNFSPESPMVPSFIGCQGSSGLQEHSGQLFPASKDSATQAADGSAQFPRRKRVQPAGQPFSAYDGTATVAAQGGLFPKGKGIQVCKDKAAQAARNGLFPPRLGVQVNEHSATQAAGDGLFPITTGVQVDNYVAYDAECGLYPKEIGVQTASCCQGGLPIQLSKDFLGPTSTTGQVISSAKGYGLSQASNVLGQSLKRGAIRPPPAAPQVRRRKTTLQPPILPSLPSQPRTAPAAAIHIPACPHIKWQDSDGLSRPSATGQKCMLCKRDLSFTAEGPVYQPSVPPSVAVLPCGHTFHDHCLEIITPEDQSKNPPCIPCAISEI